MISHFKHYKEVHLIQRDVHLHCDDFSFLFLIFLVSLSLSLPKWVRMHYHPHHHHRVNYCNVVDVCYDIYLLWSMSGVVNVIFYTCGGCLVWWISFNLT